MLKKLIIFLSLFALLSGITVSAQDIISINTPEDFYSFSENPSKLSKLLGMSETELSEYCKSNNIIYLSADNNNSRQIRILTSESSFSNSIVNLSHLTDDKITGLSCDISGIEGVHGEVVNLSGQKFLKIQVQSSDSGGDYILTQYLTVADRKNIIINFYSSVNSDLSFIEESLESLSSPNFITEESENSILFIVIPIATIALLVVCLSIGVSIIFEMKKPKDEDDEEDKIQ